MKKRAATGGVQMFSFLDAMICTLGALLVLLHAFARDRETNAVKKAEAQAAQQTTIDVDAELETLQWRSDQLREIRGKTEAQLADQRLKLAHIEDHGRRLREKAKQLEIALAELDRLNKSKDAKTLRSQAELEAARVRIVEARDALEKARERYKRAASYNVVPYEGPHTTRRRPVYIECREDSMILQPEGVELVPEDFAGFLGAGNPLASALRGTEEFYARQAVDGRNPEEPYPLLLVRPDGIMTYYAARSALGSWGSDFGYELIGSDWELKFAQPDERLAQLLRQIVTDARRRMRELVLVTNQFKAQRQRVALRASSNGGFVADRRHSSSVDGGRPGTSGNGWDGLDSTWLSGKSRSAANRSTEQGDGFGTGGSGSGGGLAAGAGGRGRSLSGNGTGPGSRYDPLYSGGDGGYSPEGNVSGNSTGNGNQPGNGPGYGTGGTGTGHDDSAGSQWASTGSTAEEGAGGGNSAAGSAPMGQPGGQTLNSHPHGLGTPGSEGAAGAAPHAGIAGVPGGSSSAPSQGQSQSGGGGSSASPGGAQSMSSAGTVHSSAGGNGGSSSAASASGGAAASGTQSHGSASQAASCGPNGDCKPEAIARRRGRDWGLQNAENTESPLTRPILVQCYPDRLVIVPEDRTQQAMITPLDGEAENTIDEFVINVWKHTRHWGIPGRGLFWKPTLVMDVAPGGDARFAEIQALLDDSGLDVQRRNRRGANASTPPTNRTR